MKRVSQSLFEEIQKVTSGELDEALTGNQHKIDANKNNKIDAQDFQLLRKKKSMKEEDKMVDKAHFCATHVEHAEYGQGFCISEAHADPDENGDIAWYTVQFSKSVKKIDTSDLNILQAESHMHSKKKKMKEEVEDLAEVSYSAKAARAGKDIGKPGKQFAKIAKSAAERYGSKERGEKVAGAVLAKLRKEEVEIEEGVAQTIINHDDFVIEITDNPTFADFLAAAKTFVNEEDAVVVAEEFFKEQDESLIIEAFTKADIDAKVNAHQKAGHSVTMPKMSTKNGQPYAEYVVTDKETKVRRKYIHHGNVRRVENMGTPGKKDRGEE